MRRWLIASLVMLTPSFAAADVVDKSAAGFTVKTVVSIAAPSDRVYEALLRVGEWWDPRHTFSGDARNLRIDAKAGGCFCETLAGGGSVQHGLVVFAQPGTTLRVNGALGPLQESGTTGSLTWALEKSGNGTMLTMTYVAGGYMAGGLDQLASSVDAVLATQVRRLKAHVERAG